MLALTDIELIALLSIPVVNRVTRDARELRVSLLMVDGEDVDAVRDSFCCGEALPQQVDQDAYRLVARQDAWQARWMVT